MHPKPTLLALQTRHRISCSLASSLVGRKRSRFCAFAARCDRCVAETLLVHGRLPGSPPGMVPARSSFRTGTCTTVKYVSPVTIPRPPAPRRGLTQPPVPSPPRPHPRPSLPHRQPERPRRTKSVVNPLSPKPERPLQEHQTGPPRDHQPPRTCRLPPESVVDEKRHQGTARMGDDSASGNDTS